MKNASEIDFSMVIRRAKERFSLSRRSVHGIGHWQRVHENGIRLSAVTGADRDLVHLFSFLHDCCRETDFSDPDHGYRAAEFTESLVEEAVITLEQERLELLLEAIREHNNGTRHRDPTIGTCWDADRLDIGRVGFRPQPRFLSTKAARDERILEWAYKRSRV